MNPSALFIKRPVMTLLLMMAMVLAGIFSYFKLPVTDLPGVDYPMLHVHAAYAGASPETMARTVATPLEKELASLEGLKQISSRNSRGSSWITLVFHLDREMSEIVRSVQEALEKAQQALPRDLTQKPTYFKAGENQDAVAYLVLTSSKATLSELYDYAHSRIEQRLARIEGVGQVGIHGSPYAVRIYLNPELMAARNLSFEEVRSTIAQATGTLPLGRLDTPGRAFTLEIPGRLQNAADFGNLLLTEKVRLKEIAEVVDGQKSEGVFHFISKEADTLAVIFGVQKQNNANAVGISQEIKRLLPEIQSELPSGMELNLWFDKATWIQEAILDVEWSLVLAFALVLGVIYVSLRRFRETLVAAAALPLSILGTLILMHALHFNLDLLSLLALTLAMGFVIDDAIVVLENIVRHREQGLSPLEAALTGSKQIFFTVVSMTLSLVAVFLPLLLMPDILGRLFREFSITLALAILVSGFVSLTLTPMLASRFSSEVQQQPSPPIFFSFYKRSLDWCLSHKKTSLVCAALTVVLAAVLFRFLPVSLFPEEDRGFIWSYIETPSSLSQQDVEECREKLCRIVNNHAAVDSFVALSFNDYQILLIRLLSSERISQTAAVAELQEKLNALPGIQAYLRGIQLISNQMGNDYSRNAYSAVLRGFDPHEVKQAAEALEKRLAQDARFIHPRLNLRSDHPILEISVANELAEKLGLTRLQVQSLLQNAYAGGQIGKIEKNSEQYSVFLELGPEFQKNSEALSKLYFKTARGDCVPLKALASWKEKSGLQSIEHIDLLPSAVLSFDIQEDLSVQEALAAFKEIGSETLPSTVSAQFEGLAEMEGKASADTAILLLFAFVAMYLVLGILYESFIHPFTILSALPFACLGGILTLLAFREPLSLYSMVGFLLLIGIVKKNGIMMIDYAIERQRAENKAPFDAIREACLIRFRPIMMTTVAAIMGALPIAIGLGAGAETRRGLGLVIAGGLLFSQFLTLYITPIIYLYLEKLRKK